jgi:hypothetical protein
MATALKLFDEPEFLDVQLIPSGEVRISPEPPTATNCAPVQTIELMLGFGIPAFRVVQTIPSGEVAITPNPAATQVLLPQTTA